jgi:hypothetical protein
MRANVTCLLAMVMLSYSALAASQTTSPDSDRIGTFKQVQGEAWVGPPAARKTAVSGEGVKIADRLSTGQTGAATITLKDGTVLTVGPNSTMDLSAFEFNSTNQEGNLVLDLLQGSVRIVTGLLGKANPDKFKVKTPTSVVGVRGTDFIVQTQAAN